MAAVIEAVVFGLIMRICMLNRSLVDKIEHLVYENRAVLHGSQALFIRFKYKRCLTKCSGFNKLATLLL